MPTHRLISLPFVLSVPLMLILVTAARAQPQFYETTLALEQPVVNVSSVKRVIYRWSSIFESVGLFTEFDLEDLTLELQTTDGSIYFDHIIVNGIVQPYSGQARTLDEDVFWRFNFDADGLEQMTNVRESIIQTSTGLQFDVHDSTSIPVDGRVNVKAYLDGMNLDPHTDQLAVQVTAPVVFFDDFETGDSSAWVISSPPD